MLLDFCKVYTNKWMSWYFHGPRELKTQQEEARRHNLSRVQMERASKLQLSRLNPSDVSNAGDWQVSRELDEVTRNPDKARELNQSMHATYDEGTAARGQLTSKKEYVGKLTTKSLTTTLPTQAGAGGVGEGEGEDIRAREVGARARA